MTGKRKREDNVGEGEGMELDGNEFVELQARFHEWLLDVLEILREYVSGHIFYTTIPCCSSALLTLTTT